MSLIRTQSLVKRFPAVTAVSELTLDIAPGVVGPRGRERRRQVHAC